MAVQIILASQSPRRKELLERVGFSVKVVPANIDEIRMDDETVEQFAKRMARTKCLAVVRRMQATLYQVDPEGGSAVPSPSARRMSETRWVVAGDTIVSLGEELLGKPKDTAEAADMLARLAGTRHRVITGFCVHDLRKDKEGVQAVSTDVLFKRLTTTEIEKYVAVGESMDKAGAYAIQGVGAYLVDSIVGSYTNVVGLPMCQVIEMMEEMGARDVLPY
ncbi:MAG: Maf family protein [Myxococcota bacterium]